MPSERLMFRRGGRVNGCPRVAADDGLEPVEPNESGDWTAPGRLRSRRSGVGEDGVDKPSMTSKLETRLCW